MPKELLLLKPHFWAILLALLPIWTLLVLFIPVSGFILYLGISDVYFSLPQLLFGSELFPTREFGTIADGVLAHVLGQGLYGLLGYAVGVVIRLLSLSAMPDTPPKDAYSDGQAK